MSKNCYEMDELIQRSESAPHCKNCASPLDGQFCSSCGQEVTPTIRYFGTVLLHLLDDIFSFDSRASRTLFPLLCKPGFLTKEYFAGRRVHYVPPLKLYLFISIVFFLSLKLFPDFDSSNKTLPTPEVIQKSIDTKVQELSDLPEMMPTTQAIEKLSSYRELIAQSNDKALQNQAINLAALELKKLNNIKEFTENDQFHYKQYQEHINSALIDKEQGTAKEHVINISNHADDNIAFDFLSKEMNEKLNKQMEMLEKKAENEINTDPTKLVQQAIAKLPQLMFILLPLFAVLLKIMYLFSNRFYLEHLTVALHSHSFIFLMMFVLGGIDAIFDLFIDDFPWLGDFFETFTISLCVWIPIYLFIMQKRVYKQGYLLTIFKYFVISSAYMILMSGTALIALVWGLISI
ncbi:MAG: DUF3667 domain-containing protein [Litorilituus sp.]|nr:DUF3667 domain-containing protein [Litorilituus sp.]